jgi:hypothetical protein
MGGPTTTTTTRDVPVRTAGSGLSRPDLAEARHLVSEGWGPDRLRGQGDGPDSRVLAEVAVVAEERGWSSQMAHRHLLDGRRAGRDLDVLLDGLWYGPPPPPLGRPRPTRRRQRPPQDRRTCRLPAMAVARHALG